MSVILHATVLRLNSSDGKLTSFEQNASPALCIINSHSSRRDQLERLVMCMCDCVSLTEHGVELLRVEVPLPPRRLVPLGLGVVGVVELGLRPERVQHPQHAPVGGDGRKLTSMPSTS